MQRHSINLPEELRRYLPALVASQLPEIHDLNVERISPLHSNVGPPVISLLYDLTTSGSLTHGRGQDAAFSTLRRAVATATEGRGTVDDEILYGRAGLLWAMLNLKAWLKSGTGVEQARMQDQRDVAGDEVVASVVSKIIETGKISAEEFKADHSDQPCPPLLWLWHGKYYLGA